MAVVMVKEMKNLDSIPELDIKNISSLMKLNWGQVTHKIFWCYGEKVLEKTLINLGKTIDLIKP